MQLSPLPLLTQRAYIYRCRQNIKSVRGGPPVFSLLVPAFQSHLRSPFLDAMFSTSLRATSSLSPPPRPLSLPLPGCL